MLVRIEMPHREIRNLDVEYLAVGCNCDVVIYDVRHPHQIVRETSADAPAGLWMPPVLNVPLDELSRGRPHDVLSGCGGLGVHEGHHVLKLITETERAA